MGDRPRGATYLLGPRKALRLSEEVREGHEEDKGHVGEEEDQVPEAWEGQNRVSSRWGQPQSTALSTPWPPYVHPPWMRDPFSHWM